MAADLDPLEPPSSRPSAAARGERERRGLLLLRLAREAIERPRDGWAWNGGTPTPHPLALGERWLLEPGASFVSLERRGELRGCIGSLEPLRALADDVRTNAHRAAFADPRFPPLSTAELAEVRIAVSLLGPLEELPATSLREAARLLVPGLDGVVLSIGTRRATLLPQVWQRLPEPPAFLEALGRKAGLTPLDRAGSTSLRFLRYRVEAWSES
jgi:AmmeMemoRadiSam system protein A